MRATFILHFLDLFLLTSCIELPRLCLKNSTTNFDIYSSKCHAAGTFPANFTEKNMIIAIKNENLVDGFGYKCSKFHKILQTQIENNFKTFAVSELRPWLTKISANRIYHCIDSVGEVIAY